MQALALPPPEPALASDRLGLSLMVAGVLHAVVILGVTFTPGLLERAMPEQSPPLQITLVHQRSDKAPEDAKLLAQANLEGGGSAADEISPQSPSYTPLPQPSAGAGMAVTLPAAPPPAPQTAQDTPLTQSESARAVHKDTAPAERPRQPMTAEEMVARSMEIATLSAEISQSMEAYAKRDKHRYISAQAREYRDAAYLDAWRAKIERIGNLNYPEEAKRRNISGSLLLDVAINSDGSLNSITLLRSSGSKVLDDAAMRIVKLAAPFAQFPDELRSDTDVLHITRTWEFLDSHRLDASR
ncbi:MAG: energy transducer TonB [Gammaproteobacteria bacterium]|nr:energy transducer TonB [Gammaproteobacteria bacterium]